MAETTQYAESCYFINLINILLNEIVTMCSICSSEETLKDALDANTKKIKLCESCRICEECNEEVEDIDSENWKIVTRVIRPAGWIFLDSSIFKQYEDFALFCGYCKDLFCNTCKSMTCKKRCNECSAPCSEGCDCI